MKEPITPEGLERFRQEFKRLYYTEKPHWVEQKQIAAEWGDRSENAEYKEAKAIIRTIDKRLRFLSRLIENSHVINPDDLSTQHVRFGMTVTLESEQGEQSWTIVGTYESEPANGKISHKSPVGKALIGKEPGDEVEINGREYVVLEITVT